MNSEKIVIQMEVWAVFTMESDDHWGLNLSTNDVETFFTDRECAEYVAMVLEGFWGVQYTIMKKIIYVNNASQDKVYGVLLYIGDDIYVCDDHVFPDREGVYDHSVIYQYYKDKYIEVNDPNDGFEYTFSATINKYGIYRGDLDSLKERFNPESYSNTQIRLAPEVE